MRNNKSNKLDLRQSLIAIWPALAVLFSTLIIAAFIAEFTYTTGMKALWVVLFRFFRLLLILTLTLLLLQIVCKQVGSLVNRGNGQLVVLEDMRSHVLTPSKIWFIRPFQGIALIMLMAAKLINVLQLYTHTIDNTVILPPGQFDPWRLVAVSCIIAVTALLLSVLWAMDDLSIRYFNRKTKEIKMAGKYLGVLLPVFFGVYGIANLFEQYEYFEAMQYIVQMVIIFYPPLVIFGVLHNIYIRAHESKLLKQLGAEPYAITINERGMNVTKM
jgi:hypothetical protein